MTEELGTPPMDGETSPEAGSWAAWYALVLGALAAEVMLFYLFTRAFS